MFTFIKSSKATKAGKVSTSNGIEIPVMKMKAFKMAWMSKNKETPVSDTEYMLVLLAIDNPGDAQYADEDAPVFTRKVVKSGKYMVLVLENGTTIAYLRDRFLKMSRVPLVATGGTTAGLATGIVAGAFSTLVAFGTGVLLIPLVGLVCVSAAVNGGNDECRKAKRDDISRRCTLTDYDTGVKERPAPAVVTNPVYVEPKCQCTESTEVYSTMHSQWHCDTYVCTCSTCPYHRRNAA